MRYETIEQLNAAAPLVLAQTNIATGAIDTVLIRQKSVATNLDTKEVVVIDTGPVFRNAHEIARMELEEAGNMHDSRDLTFDDLMLFDDVQKAVRWINQNQIDRRIGSIRAIPLRDVLIDLRAKAVRIPDVPLDDLKLSGE